MTTAFQGDQIECDICHDKEWCRGQYGEIEMPDGWESVDGNGVYAKDVCKKCCVIIRTIALK